MDVYKLMASAHCKLASDARDLRDGTMDGQTMVEYALLVALIAVALIAVIGVLAGQIGTKFNAVSDQLKATTTNTVPTA